MASTQTLPSSPSRARRGVAALSLIAALGATSGLAACGSASKPSQSAIAAKLKSESELSSFNAKQVNCIAGVVRQYGSTSSLNDYVNGKITADKLTGSDKSSVQTKTAACIKDNT